MNMFTQKEYQQTANPHSKSQSRLEGKDLDSEGIDAANFPSRTCEICKRFSHTLEDRLVTFEELQECHTWASTHCIFGFLNGN